MLLTCILSCHHRGGLPVIIVAITDFVSGENYLLLFLCSSRLLLILLQLLQRGDLWMEKDLLALCRLAAFDILIIGPCIELCCRLCHVLVSQGTTFTSRFLRLARAVLLLA